MSPHTASQKYSFDWRHVSFPRPLRVSLLCKAFNHDNFPKTRAAKKNPCWQLHFMASSTSILSLVFADEAANGAKSEWSSIGPAFVELRALTRTSTAWKIRTHTSGSRRPSFSVLMLRPQEFWSLKKLPFTIFVVHATTWKWLSLDSRRLLGFQSSCHESRGECDRARAGSSLVDFEGIFFFWYFRKKLRARGTRNKENNNTGLKSKQTNKQTSWTRKITSLLYAFVFTQVTDSAICHMACMCPHLSLVILSGIHSLTDKSMKYLAEHCPRLEDMYIAGCHRISKAAVAYVEVRLSLVSLLPLPPYIEKISLGVFPLVNLPWSFLYCLETKHVLAKKHHTLDRLYGCSSFPTAWSH